LSDVTPGTTPYAPPADFFANALTEQFTGPPQYDTPPPPPPPPAPSPKTGDVWWKSRTLRVVLSAVLVLAGILVAVVGGGGGKAAAAGEIFLDGRDTPGTQTFTPSIAEPPPAQLAPNATETPKPSSGGTIKTEASSPGLYGGQRGAPNCNAGSLIAFLESKPDVARPWAAALGFAPSQIRGYVNTLTPVTLRVDTRVTEYGLANGRAVPRQSIIQAGSGVLVDRTAFPRVRCAGGNPLGEARPVVAAPRYTGPRWPGFSPTTIVVVTPARGTSVITLIDIVTGDPFARVPGSVVIVDIDRPAQGVNVLLVEQGQPMEYVGTDWPPGTPVGLVFDDPGVQLGADVADGGGNVRIGWTVPPTAPVGPHTVTASGGGFATTQDMYVIPPPIRIL
jgi:hypothetical protein